MQKIKEHPTHVVLGIGVIAIGLWLMINDHFFMWPPQAVGVANDDVWGALFYSWGIDLTPYVPVMITADEYKQITGSDYVAGANA